MRVCLYLDQFRRDAIVLRTSTAADNKLCSFFTTGLDTTCDTIGRNMSKRVDVRNVSLLIKASSLRKALVLRCTYVRTYTCKGKGKYRYYTVI